MSNDAVSNYEQTKQQTGYKPRTECSSNDYKKLGFKSGLEVHQQLRTQHKLFCRCPAGIYQDFDDYDAELIRHMRPTLSEMGTYDGTALMEFKTRKNIFYRIKNETTCTYEIDDTPPFPINREALNYAIQIALMLKTNLVGELHITRKQYLDGSIPTGFQRTAIVGIEGEIPLSKKKVRIIQISLEEDSCREVSDIGHNRTYTTDRLGIPLIETVTYPDMQDPNEVMEAGHTIRFLNRSSNKVRVGIGSARQDVNVSIAGGTRVEIKGVSHISWIPELTHNEAFRQKALLHIKDILKQRIKIPEKWNFVSKRIDFDISYVHYPPILDAMDKGYHLIAVNLPGFKDILSHFTQPGRTFADEISGRLKVIPCLEQQNMIHSEDLIPVFDKKLLEKRRKLLHCGRNDAQIVFWAPVDDVETAIETIKERCLLALKGVPNETRKALRDGTTIFERVLPGADRMYPDTDSAPIPIREEDIQNIRKKLPEKLEKIIGKLKKWKIPSDTYHYILRNNLILVIGDIIKKYKLDPVFIASVLAHRLKYVEGHFEVGQDFSYHKIEELIAFIKSRNLTIDLIKEMIPLIYQNPGIDFESVLHLIKFHRHSKEKILHALPILHNMFLEIRKSDDPESEIKWIMGQLRILALGNLELSKLSKIVRDFVLEHQETHND